MSNKNERIGYLQKKDGLLSVGFGNCVPSGRVVALLEPNSSASRRLRKNAVTAHRLIDATAGRKMRSLIVTDSNHVILSALAPQTLQERLQEKSQAHLKSLAIMEVEDGEFVS